MITADMPKEEICRLIQEAIDGRNDMVWSAMQYQCERCRAVEWVYLGVGVEGPQELRDRNAYIPSPFMGPRCLACGGPSKHINWTEDKVFLPIDAGSGVRYYKVPRPWPENDRRHYGSIAFCGVLAVAPK